MVQLVTLLATLIYNTHHHHVHGAHVDNVGTTIITPRRSNVRGGRGGATTTAFQFPENNMINKKGHPPSTSLSIALRYSREEGVEGGGIHNLLTPSKQTSFFSDMNKMVNTMMDHNNEDPNKSDTTKNNGIVIDDEFTNDTKERRTRRLQSLEHFNQVTHEQTQHNRRNALEADVEKIMELLRRSNNEDIASSSPSSPSSPSAGGRVGGVGEQHPNLELPYNDLSQLQAIRSNAPAILLPSGPGTGKSHVLSLRIAYLLQKHIQSNNNNNNQDSSSTNIMLDDISSDIFCTPDSMVILSFTNKDAERLKQRALDYLFPQTTNNKRNNSSNNNNNSSNNNDVAESEQQITRNEMSQQLWAGTMHAFSLAILRKYGSYSSSPSSSSSSSSSMPLRVLPAREMRNRVSASLRALMNGINQDMDKGEYQSRYSGALEELGHSRSILQQNIVRCIDLWKEANMPLHPPESSSSIPSIEIGEDYYGDHRSGEEENEQLRQEDQQRREVRVRKSCIELAMRLGIPKTSALLALDVYPEYQARHAADGTCDPSDLAAMAHRLLLEQQPKTLHLLRSKLKHIIVDEYQDMSVSQHALLRLVVRGRSSSHHLNEDGSSGKMMSGAMRKKKKKEMRRRLKLPVLLEPSNDDHHHRHHHRHNKRGQHKTTTSSSSSRSHTTPPHNTFQQSYSVPSIFCAGDASQSIYGWRGGAPELTVHGFRRDYPQGVIAPLSTCYRLPNDIVDAASMLLPVGLDLKENFWDCGGVEVVGGGGGEAAYDISPAAAAKVASSLQYAAPKAVNVAVTGDPPRQVLEDSKMAPPPPSRHHHQRSAEENVRLGNQLLLSKGMQKLDSNVIIHGLWDSREEAKYIASTIRRRSKARRKALMGALTNLDDDYASSFSSPEGKKELLDLTDVAVMVRSSKQLDLLREALENAGVPFVTSDSNKNKHSSQDKEEDESTRNWLSQKRARSVKTIPMTPATIMTMHRSKGEEYDDIYLAGWTEGDFPHPEAVSSNRVHEERRLAYVALTRARQRVVITHSFVKRVLHYGRDGRKKYVTGQVEPSRFLYELVPSKRIEDGVAMSADDDDDDESGDFPWDSSEDNEGTVWDRSVGVKEAVVGQNVPDFFQKAYQQPKGYVAKRSELQGFANNHAGTSTNKEKAPPPSPQTSRGNEIVSQRMTPLEIIEDALNDIIVLRKKGASQKYAPVFREMLASFFRLRRGNALVFASGARSDQTRNESVYALVEASAKDLVEKPLGKCTATQLGHYLAYLIQKPKTSGLAMELKLIDTQSSSRPNPTFSSPKPLQIVVDGLNDIIVLRKRGACKQYSPVFKELLVSLFRLRRGTALVFASGARSEQTRNQSVHALVEASSEDLVTKPLGRCTATQLGHYLAYLILTSDHEENKS